MSGYAIAAIAALVWLLFDTWVSFGNTKANAKIPLDGRRLYFLFSFVLFLIIVSVWLINDFLR